jgi:hypothetical protein
VAVTAGAACSPAGSGQADADAGVEDVGPEWMPDFGEIPEGHVVFALSYVRGGGAPAQIYAQEFDVSNWPDESGGFSTERLREWVLPPGWPLTDTGFQAAWAHACSCSACRRACDLHWSGLVYEIHWGQVVAFEWDGRFWDRAYCSDARDCLAPRLADPGRYAVQFCPSYSHERCSDGIDCRVGPLVCETVEFDYPQDGIIWHTVDCSAADELGEFPELCVRTTFRLAAP